jgi:hypothetical protein
MPLPPAKCFSLASPTICLDTTKNRYQKGNGFRIAICYGML